MNKSTYNTIAENPKSTVVAKYTPCLKNASQYQSENDLELEFVHLLKSNGYEYLNITNNNDLLQNLKIQLEKLNNIEFSDKEWQQLLNNYLAKKNQGIEEKTINIQENYIFNLKRDNGSTKNVWILDKDNIQNNSLQLINQYESKGTYKNRYDVTILVNGLPMVHVELKRRGVSIREAFNQINRYQRDSFWADSGLFEYVQLFVISNGTDTKYYSNTTRNAHLKDEQGIKSRKKTSNSFEFTCWWSDAENKRISDLVDFSKTFFSKHSLLEILTKYCVFTSDKLLLVMRPYQIVAAERIINRIKNATNHGKLGTIDAGGYIWHTTGSGKTLTSFKTAQLACKLETIDKVLFVVDRKDLDYQTMKEYDKFEKGSANSNNSTKILTRQLGDPNAKIIITTIQKLSVFITKNKEHSIFDKHNVLIFDECHRSQFGDMHSRITKAFKHYNIFGFTGTPILKENASSNLKLKLKTTEQAFGKKLHAYTISDAIIDENVLKFKIDYIKTTKIKDNIDDKKVKAIDTEAAANSKERIEGITDYILEHFDQKTKRNSGFYLFNKLSNITELASDKEKGAAKKKKEIRTQVSLKGFNSIFAVSSITVAKKYYNEFKKRDSGLKIATIFSFIAKKNDDDSHLQDESFDTDNLDKSSRDFLDTVIKDYNKYFKTNYDTSAEKFENYYKDISQRMKNREIDLLIVVNMFLTGFDSTILNTLWVDKNLRYHGLLQAFSRTNRILNSVKTHGNIVCFRDLENATNEALSIFGNKDAKGMVLLKTFEDYYYGEDKDGKPQKSYVDLIAELKERFSLPVTIVGEQAEKDFIRLWNAILRLCNILSSFDEFEDRQILSAREYQDYQSVYIELYEKLRKDKESNKENINDDLEFEIELVKQVTINIDYILQLLAKYHKPKVGDEKVKIDNIYKTIDSSIELRSKKELIEKFVNTLNVQSDIDNDWKKFVDKSKSKELDEIVKKEKLNPEKTKKIINNAFKNGELKSTGTEFADILPPMPMFDNNRAKKKTEVFTKLKLFFDRYIDL